VVKPPLNIINTQNTCIPAIARAVIRKISMRFLPAAARRQKLSR